MYILTSPFNKTFDTLGLLYFVPHFLSTHIQKWFIVEIPLWKKIEYAVVLEIVESLEAFNIQHNFYIKEEKIKSIIQIILEKPLISENNIALSQWISEHYFTQIHNSINLFFPKIVRKEIEKQKHIFKADFVKNKNAISKGTQKKSFSSAQEKAYNQIKAHFTKNNKINLLYWITWSGKTEIYIKLIEESLLQWEQALLLIPEIILNNQIWEKIINTFANYNVVIINSSVTDKKKREYFLDILSWKVHIVVWTRSALFLPYKNLGIIIMDEEHDSSYNSDKSPRYKSKEIINKISSINPHINILLGSGTPSITSMYKWVKKEWNVIYLLEKFK